MDRPGYVFYLFQGLTKLTRETGIVTFITVRTVSHQLQQIRELTQVKDDQQRPTMIDQTTEDGQYQYNPIVTMLNSTPLEALKLDTLQRLADGPVYELRVA